MKLGLKINKVATEHSAVKVFFDAARFVTGDIASWAKNDLAHWLIYGGGGIDGIINTPFFRWITSEEGLSELGIRKEDAMKLLMAYQETFIVRNNNTTVEFLFGNVAKLITNTPHPYAGVGKLTDIRSWMEWVVDKKAVKEHGFVSRDNLPGNLRRHIRLASPLGGLMLSKDKFGSAGKWRVPAEFTHYDVRWFEENKERIIRAIVDKMTVSLGIALRK